MTAKLDLFAAAPAGMKDWMTASRAINASIEPSLAKLVEIRASQLNGCANCINMHTTEARALGETEQRIYLLSAWREAPCYTDRERAALAWTDALTQLSRGAHPRGGLRCAQGPLHRGGAGEAHAGDQRHQRLEPADGGLRRVARDARPEDGGVTGAGGASGRGGELRPAASAAHPRRLPHARLGRRRRGRGAGGVHPLDGRRPRRGARAGGVPPPHGDAALPRPAQVGAAPAGGLCRPVASRSRWSRGEEAEEEDITLPLMLALERLSPLERAAFLLHDVFGVGFEEVAVTIRRDPGRLPEARRPRAGPCPRGAAPL